MAHAAGAHCRRRDQYVASKVSDRWTGMVVAGSDWWVTGTDDRLAPYGTALPQSYSRHRQQQHHHHRIDRIRLSAGNDDTDTRGTAVKAAAFRRRTLDHERVRVFSMVLAA